MLYVFWQILLHCMKSSLYCHYIILLKYVVVGYHFLTLSSIWTIQIIKLQSDTICLRQIVIIPLVRVC